MISQSGNPVILRKLLLVLACSAFRSLIRCPQCVPESSHEWHNPGFYATALSADWRSRFFNRPNELLEEFEEQQLRKAMRSLLKLTKDDRSLIS